jgi:hypothetical protein
MRLQCNEGFDERLGCMVDIKRQHIRLYVLEIVSMIIFFRTM